MEKKKGSYSVPAEIRALKPIGTEVKKIHNNYYVYQHFNEKGRTAPGINDPVHALGPSNRESVSYRMTQKTERKKLQLWNMGSMRPPFRIRREPFPTSRRFLIRRMRVRSIFTR